MTVLFSARRDAPERCVKSGKARAKAQAEAKTSVCSQTIRIHRWVPGGRQVLTSLVMKWAADGLLCRLTLEGRAATVAQFR